MPSSQNYVAFVFSKGYSFLIFFYFYFWNSMWNIYFQREEVFVLKVPSILMCFMITCFWSFAVVLSVWRSLKCTLCDRCITFTVPVHSKIIRPHECTMCDRWTTLTVPLHSKIIRPHVYYTNSQSHTYTVNITLRFVTWDVSIPIQAQPTKVTQVQLVLCKGLVWSDSQHPGGLVETSWEHSEYSHNDKKAAVQFSTALHLKQVKHG